jgi:flagellum-specific peptidoglycan hydrolase FlgJ
MKADLINNTWKDYSVWSGESFIKTTPEYYNGKLTYIRDEFRVYKDYENCIRDYEQFLLNVQNAYGYKYRKVSGMVDPEKVITAISQGGYATDPNYIKSVMRLINEYNLTKYDDIARNSTHPTEPTIEPNVDPAPVKHYVV